MFVGGFNGRSVEDETQAATNDNTRANVPCERTDFESGCLVSVIEHCRRVYSVI